MDREPRAMGDPFQPNGHPETSESDIKSCDPDRRDGLNSSTSVLQTDGTMEAKDHLQAGGSSNSSLPVASKRLKWDAELHKLFLHCVRHLGGPMKAKVSDRSHHNLVHKSV